MNRISILGSGLGILAVLAAAPAVAQVAPTLPRDTLDGARLAPEANVPRGVVAPTLPRDTLAGARLPPTANVILGQTPTMPSDSIDGVGANAGRTTLSAAGSDSAHGAPTLHATSDSGTATAHPVRNPRLREPR